MENTLNKALDLINEENYIEAQGILKNILEQDDKNKEVIKNLGLCEINLDNPIGAIEMFKRAYELDNSDALSLFYLASAKTQIGEKEEAIEYFKKVLSLRPDYLDVYKNLAMIYIEFSQIENAIEIMQEALKNENLEFDYSCFYILATAYMLKKDQKNASIYLEKALELNPNHIQIMNSLAVCYMNLEQDKKALELLNSAFEVDEKNSLTLYNLGVYFENKEDFKKALEYFKKSYDIEPSVSMLSSMANCATKAQDFALAANLYKSLIVTYPNNSQYRISYIEALEAQQEYKEALMNVNLLLAVDEKNVELAKKKGSYLRKLNYFDEAICVFDGLLKRGKVDIEVYYNLAFCYVELEDNDKAQEMFKKCITLEPNNPYAHKDLGVLYLKMNAYDWALDEIEQAIKLEDDVAEFHYSYGVCNMMLNKTDVAKEAFKKAVELDDTSADAFAYLGYIALIENQLDVSFELLQKALKIDPMNFLAKNHLAKYYFSQAKYETAKELLLDVIQTTKDDETMNMLAISYMETKEEKNAMGIFSKLIARYPQNHILLTNLAKCELKCNRKKEAQEHLRQALLIFDDYEPALKLLGE
ncbi:MAG: tetratricopeptide repeat protein [Candidatus Gastranaerophilales bacterium]|nr:tetratricopeptide repeat protein [Candidatus Gastranaerophilales bacterium]